jgi:hypothetical protein
MMQQAPEMTTFPCECPNCRDVAGFPYRVGTDAKRRDCVHLEIRCRSCNSEWHLERATTARTPIERGWPYAAH